MADTQRTAEEAKRLLGLLFEAEPQQDSDAAAPTKEPLFVPGDSSDAPQTSKHGLHVHQQVLDRRNAPRNTCAYNPALDNIVVDASKGYVYEGNKRWIMPADIAKLLSDGAVERIPEYVDPDHTSAKDFTELEALFATRNIIPMGRPGYWLHFTEGELSDRSLPVYGYMHDLGYHNAAPPEIDDVRDQTWDNCEWLCRCAQCGRELPPAAYKKAGSPGSKASRNTITSICRDCFNTNATAVKIYRLPFTQRTMEQQTFLDQYCEMIDVLWDRGLTPRGAVARDRIGEDKLKKRIGAARSSTDRASKHYNRHNPVFAKRAVFMQGLMQQ